MPMSVVYATVNGRMVQENRGGTITKYVADTLGSVIQTRNASGIQTSSTTYWPYGEVRTSSGTNPSPWGFCGIWGYLTDAATRLYVRARNYRADLSRWNTLDPLWPDESAYGYVNNGPVDQNDPSGRQSRRGCPHHGGEPGCVFNGPPGSESDPAYWHCQTPLYDRPPSCLECLNDIYKRTGKAYNGKRGFPNAMRHCVGTCLANQECGQFCSFLVILHEVQTWSTDDSRRDRHNNDVVHGIGRIRPKADCHKKCGQAYREGRLR